MDPEGAGSGRAAGGNTCEACGAPGAIQRCARCRLAVYCGAACQRSHWRGSHKRTCRAAGTMPPGGFGEAPGQVAVAAGVSASPPRAQAEAAAEPSATQRAVSGAAGGDGSAPEDSGAEPINPCPICLSNEDDFEFGGSGASAMCSVCGQQYCGECNVKEGTCAVDLCPTCRAPVRIPDAEKFRNVWSLVHDRSPGRHTCRSVHTRILL